MAVEASVALRRTANRGCVRRYASCPNQRRANTPHCAVPLKVCWISLWCLETLQRTTQTQSRRHESLSLFPRSLPLRSSRRPFFSAVEQTAHCCRGSGGEVDAVAGKMKKDRRLKCPSKCSFVFPQIPLFLILLSLKLVLFQCFAHYCVLCTSTMDTISSRWSFHAIHFPSTPHGQHLLNHLTFKSRSLWLCAT